MIRLQDRRRERPSMWKKNSLGNCEIRNFFSYLGRPVEFDECDEVVLLLRCLDEFVFKEELWLD